MRVCGNYPLYGQEWCIGRICMFAVYSIWIHMSPYGSIWTDSMWIHMVWDYIWTHVDSYGSICRRLC